MLVAIAATALATAAPQDATVLGPHAPVPGAALSPPTASASGSAFATVVFTNVPGAAASNVPGLAGTTFEPGTGLGTFDRVYGHPNGHWVLTAHANLPSSEDECLLVDGQLLQREGQPAPWTGGAENCGTIDTRCAVNASGEVAFATNSSATSLDDYVATNAGGVWSYAAREGDSVPGLAGVTLDDTIDSPVLLDDGRVGYSADGIDGAVTTDEDDVLILGASLLLQEGVDMPPGQAAGGSAAIENFDLGDFWVSGDGAHWLVQGDLDGGSGIDDVVIVNGAVVLQEGSTIPGSGFNEPIDSAGIFGVSMDASGTWFARGDNDATNQDWVVRNGVVVAQGGAPITLGSLEVWDDASYSDGFFSHAGNSIGSWVVGGTTSEADPARDAVLVMNGEAVVARESDPVDLDGNGVYDDGVYFDAFGDDDLLLTDDLELYVVATLKNVSGVRVGQALVRIDVSSGVATPYCDGVVNSTGGAATLIGFGSSSVAVNDLRLVARGLPVGVPTLFLAGRNRSMTPGYGGGQGTLCVGGAVGRFIDAGEFGLSDDQGRAQLQVDLAAIPQPLGTVVGVLGETWRFQVWFRDDALGMPTTNFSGAVEVLLD